MELDKAVAVVKAAVEKGAKQARDDAGYSGSWGDGGASQSEERLKYWLDGISFQRTGISAVYGHILVKAELATDTEYQEFLRLQEKFKDVK